MKEQGLRARKEVRTAEPASSTHLGPGVHLLGVAGDTPQAVGGGLSWRVALLHQVWEVDVAGEAIAVAVAWSLLVSGCLRRHNMEDIRGSGQRSRGEVTPHTAQAWQSPNWPKGVGGEQTQLYFT